MLQDERIFNNYLAGNSGKGIHPHSSLFQITFIITFLPVPGTDQLLYRIQFEGEFPILPYIYIDVNISKINPFCAKISLFAMINKVFSLNRFRQHIDNLSLTKDTLK